MYIEISQQDFCHYLSISKLTTNVLAITKPNRKGLLSTYRSSHPVAGTQALGATACGVSATTSSGTGEVLPLPTFEGFNQLNRVPEDFQYRKECLANTPESEER